MKKLRLQLDDLRVETFETSKHPTERGTVLARAEPDTATAPGRWGCACGTAYYNTCGTCAPTFAVTCTPNPACGTDYETLYQTCGDPTCHWEPDGAAVLC
jgi:hypothetical protein